MLVDPVLTDAVEVANARVGLLSEVGSFTTPGIGSGLVCALGRGGGGT